MALTIERSVGYARNYARLKGEEKPCVVCGKGIRYPIYYVHVHGGGAEVVTEAEAEARNRAGGEGGDLYAQAIGADCLARHPEYRPYVAEG